MMDRMLTCVMRFAREIRRVQVPMKPTRLTTFRKQAAVDHLYEEFDEYREADTLHGEVDALVDLVYVALGRLVEMGIVPGPVFDVVHEANMCKMRGDNEKRPNDEHDAVKPKGWKQPNLTAALSVGMADVLALSHVLLEVSRLRASQGRNYNNSGVAISDYFPMGHASYFQMVHLKTKRLQSLLEMGADVEPHHEGLRDSLLDLLNYAVFWVEAIDGGDLDR